MNIHLEIHDGLEEQPSEIFEKLSERDARNGLPPLTHNDQRPTQTFLPEVPQPNTGEFQDGIVAITVPEIHVAEEDFYGQIIIYQV